jgi:hypothetical protein
MINTPDDCIGKGNSHHRLIQNGLDEPREPYAPHKPHRLSGIERGERVLLRFPLGCA